jgi:hypothetical protein
MDDVTAAGTGAAGLATRGARWALVFVWTMGVAKGVIDGRFAHPDPLLMTAYAVALGGALVLTHPVDRPLSGIRAALVPIAALTVTALVLLADVPAQPEWLIDFSAYLLALLIARGNPVLGLGCGVVQVAGVVLWGIATGRPASGVTAMLAIAVMSYVLGIIWRMVLRGVVRQERAHRTEAAESDRRERAARAAAAQFQLDLEAIRDQAAPVLSRIARGDDLDPALLADISVLEGAIRDRVRSPRLRHPQLDEAVSRARRRGVRVTLLADVGTVPRTIGDAAAGRIVDILGRHPAARSVVVAAAAPESDELSVLVETPEGHAREVVDDPAAP